MKIQQLMKQAQQMQEKLQREVSTLVVEGSAGGGMVNVVMSGHRRIQSVKIDPEVIDSEDPGMLEDLVLTAVNEASNKIDQALQEKMGGMAGGLPGLFQ
ncbi:MAG: YbaB/EbfC family nucleoid-associated protein [Acidobacteriota bacterium]|nr:YbaB/EbfC family nucleoid-associated protein [Acidobacteriota bacterium]